MSDDIKSEVKVTGPYSSDDMKALAEFGGVLASEGEGWTPFNIFPFGGNSLFILWSR